MFKDILESFRVNWISRISSPLFAALAVSWAVWNHRLLFTLFANQTIPWRFAYIDKVLYPTWEAHVLYHLLLPIVSAIVYLYLFPIPARGVFRHTLKNKVELNNLAKQIEGQRLLTEEDAKALREQMANVEATRAKQEEELKSQLKLFRESNSQLSSQLLESKKKLSAARVDAISVRPDQAKKRMEDFLLSHSFMLIFNMKLDREKGSKRIVFAEGGAISMGGNDNEHAWDVTREGKLQFINSEGAPRSEFTYDPLHGNLNGIVLKDGMTQLLSPARDTQPD